MRLSIEYPDNLDEQIREIAEAEGKISRGAVFRKALTFFLNDYTSKNKRKQTAKTNTAEVK